MFKDSVWERLIEKLYVIDFDFVVRFIKIELGELGEFVFCVIVICCSSCIRFVGCILGICCGF